MDNILEILIPLIIAGVYFFGNMFSGKSEDEEDAPTLRPNRRDPDGEDVAERQRRVQEEIRRKIMERRQSSGDSPVKSAPPASELRDRRQEVEAQRQALQTEARARDAAREREKDAPDAWTQKQRAEHNHDAPVFSWDDSDNPYENSIQAKMRRIEETNKKAKELEKQAKKRRGSQPDSSRGRKRQSGGYFTGTVRESLNDPRAARVAFVYGEVLGQPVSQRKNSNVPGLKD